MEVDTTMPVAMLVAKNEKGYESVFKNPRKSNNNDVLFEEFIKQFPEFLRKQIQKLDTTTKEEFVMVIVKTGDGYKVAAIPLERVTIFSSENNDKDLALIAAQAFLYTDGVANLTPYDISTEKEAYALTEIPTEDCELTLEELEDKYGEIVVEYDEELEREIYLFWDKYSINRMYPALGIKGNPFTVEEIINLFNSRSIADVKGNAGIIYTNLRIAAEVAKDEKLIDAMLSKDIYIGAPVTRVRGRIYEDKKVSIPTYEAIDKDIILNIEKVEPHMYIDKAAENEIAVYGVDVFTDKGEKIHIVNLTSHPLVLKDSSGNNETVLDVLSTWDIVRDPDIGEDIVKNSYTINVEMFKDEMPVKDSDVVLVNIEPYINDWQKLEEAIIMAREYAIRDQKGADKIYAVVSYPTLVAITKHLQDYPNGKLAELLNKKPQIEFVKGSVVRNENETYMLLDKWQQIKEIKKLPSYEKIFAIEEKINERYQQIFKSVRHLKQVLRGIAWLGNYHVVLDIWRQYRNTGNKELDKIGDIAETVLKEFGYFRKSEKGMKEYIYDAPNQDIVLKFDELVDALFLLNFDYIQKKTYENWKEADNILNDPDMVLYSFFDHKPLFDMGYSGDYAVYWTKHGKKDIWLLAEKDSEAEKYFDAVVYSSSVNMFLYHEVITPETIPTEVKRRTGVYRKMKKNENNRGLSFK